MVGSSKGGDLALALAVTQRAKVGEILTNCNSAVKKALTGSGCCYNQRLSRKCRRGHHKEGEEEFDERKNTCESIVKRGRIIMKVLQGQTIFPGLGLKTDFEPKLREDGTLDCLGAMQVIITK